MRRLAIGFIVISYRILYCSIGDSWLLTFGNLELAAIEDQQSFWRHWHCSSRSCCWPVTLICSIWNPLSHSAVCLFLHATSADDILMVMNYYFMNSALVDTGSLPRPDPTRPKHLRKSGREAARPHQQARHRESAPSKLQAEQRKKTGRTRAQSSPI